LSSKKRSKTGIEVTDDLVEMFLTTPVDQWSEELDTCDIPHDYFITFAALISTGTSLVLPFKYTTIGISALAKFLIPKDDADFIIFKYLPRLGLATRDIELTHTEK